MTFIEEAQRLLSRLVCVYFGYISQGAAGGALAGCYEPTAQVLLYSYTLVISAFEPDSISKTEAFGNYTLFI